MWGQYRAQSQVRNYVPNRSKDGDLGDAVDEGATEENERDEGESGGANEMRYAELGHCR